MAFEGFLGRPRPPKPRKAFLLRVKVSLLRVLGFARNREGFLFKGFWALRKVFVRVLTVVVVDF